MIGGSGSEIKIDLLNFINHQSEIDIIFLFLKDTYVTQYQLLIDKREQTNDIKTIQMIWTMFTWVSIDTFQIKTVKY